MTRRHRESIKVPRLPEGQACDQDVSNQSTGGDDTWEEPAELSPRPSPTPPLPLIHGRGPCPVSWRRGKPYPLVPLWFAYTDTPRHIPDAAKESRIEYEYGNIDSPPSLPSVCSMRRIGRKFAQKLSLL